MAPGSCSFPEKILFDQRGVFATDGTAAGTILLKAAVPGVKGFTPLADTAPLGNRLVFVGEASSQNQLWITDGTPSGTVRYRVLRASTNFGGGYASIDDLTAVGQKIVFSYSDGTTAGYGHLLWVTDGTAAGTFRLRGIDTPRLGSNSALLGSGKLIFRTYEAMWATDGTQAGTKQLRAGDYDTADVPITSIGNLALFSVSLPGGRQIWRTDGTKSGTVPVATLPGKMDYGAPDFFAFGGKALFAYNSALGVTDGTAKGTRMLPGVTVPTLGPAAALGGKVIFQASEGLFVSDGTPEKTSLILPANANIAPFQTRVIMEIVSLSHEVVFSAANAVKKSEYLRPAHQLWRSDGTAAGTKPLDYFTPHAIGAGIDSISALGDAVLVSVDDGPDDSATLIVSSTGQRRDLAGLAGLTTVDVDYSATLCRAQHP